MAYGVTTGGQKVGARTPADCEEECTANRKCAFFSHSHSAKSKIQCGYCSACDLSAGGLSAATSMHDRDGGFNYIVRDRKRYTSWAKATTRYERVSSHVAVHALATRWLQGNYSQALYLSDGRVVPETLRILWLDLMPSGALQGLAPNFRNPLPPMLPFFSAMGMSYSINPVTALWIHQPAPHAPIPSHSWVEVTHCKGPTTGPSWKHMPMWLYAAPGSGVSVNIGNTLVFRSFHRAITFLANLFCEPPTCDFNYTSCPLRVDPLEEPVPSRLVL